MSVVNHKYRYIFCHEPYAAGRAIEKALMRHEGSQNFNGEHHIDVIKMIGHEWVTEEQFDKYWKFRVIRNPYDWLVTAWIHNDSSKTMFSEWVMTKGLGLITYGTLFWRYHEQVDQDLRYENLQNELNQCLWSQGAPTVRLEVVGKTVDKPRWDEMITVSDARRLEKLYSDIRRFRYNLFK